MAIYTKQLLSASIDGQQIVIGGTSVTASTIIHTAPSGSAYMDEVWIYAYNDNMTSRVLNIAWGSLNESSSITRYDITSQGGRVLIIDGKLIMNGRSVYAYCSTSGSIFIDGFVNRIELP
jgi:hypothetical protein